VPITNTISTQRLTPPPGLSFSTDRSKPERALKRTQSLPTEIVKLTGRHASPKEPLGNPLLQGNLSEDKVSSFLAGAGLNIALRENRLVITGHLDPEAAEAQRLPSGRDLGQVCQAIMSAGRTAETLDIAAVLLPVVNAQLLEHIASSKTDRDLKEWVRDFAKSYFDIFGGRDLAIDDVISAVNTYFFDKIGTDTALKSTNIAAAALTTLFMLVPTIGKNLPPLVEAVREKRYQDAIMPALSILAISAMTLNPTMAAIGHDRASAIAGAIGNALMMTHLPGILHHGYEWTTLSRTNFVPDTHPFTCFARSHGLVDQGLHAALDFLHEFGAQAGFFAFNVKNAIEVADSARNPVVFPLLAVLLGSFAMDTARGDQPFSEFATSRKVLAEDLATSSREHDARGHAAMLFLHQKITATYDADYGSLLSAISRASSVGSHITRQVGNTLPDAVEKTFLKGLLSRFVVGKEVKDAVHVAIDRIYRFEVFDPAAHAGGDKSLAEILRFVQSQRNEDKALFRNERGLVLADHVYRSIISHAIKCVALEELGR
jgi:hypothetical protein